VATHTGRIRLLKGLEVAGSVVMSLAALAFGVLWLTQIDISTSLRAGLYAFASFAAALTGLAHWRLRSEERA
jgi:hypothetical protein